MRSEEEFAAERAARMYAESRLAHWHDRAVLAEGALADRKPADDISGQRHCHHPDCYAKPRLKCEPKE